MKVIYVAGKYLGNGDWETYLNIHRARVASHKLWDDGWAVICPHANTAFFGGDTERQDRKTSSGNWMQWIKGDLEILGRCDAIYMLENWENSKGAKMELEHAKKLGMEVIYELALKRDNPYNVNKTSDEEMKIYLAGGMKGGWQDYVKEKAPKHEYYDPRVDTEQLRNFLIAKQDFDGVDWADMVFTYFERDNPSGIGLALEVGYAVAKGKRVIIVDEHDRLHGFLAGCGERLYTSFHKAVEDLNGNI